MTGRRSHSPELLIEVLDRAGASLHGQLRTQLLNAIEAGRLGPGDRLPPTRQLAHDLQVARGTVVDVYDQLIQEGYLTAAHGSGTAVGDRLRGAEPAAPQLDSASSSLLDLRPGAPDMGMFPRQTWARASGHVLRTISDAELGYVTPWGVEALRSQLAHYLGRTRHVTTDAERVVITSGVTQGLTLLCRLLYARGHRQLVVEDPSNAIQRQVLSRSGLEIVEVGVDDEGILVEELKATGSRAVLVTPAHQYPTGVIMSDRRRRALIDWASSCDGIILEDDYDAEFQYGSTAAPSLQAAGPDHVVHLSSVSKTLVPGVRLGWAVVPEHLRAELTTAKRDDDFGTSVFDQHTLAHLISTGAYDRHIRRQRARYRLQRSSLVTALGEHLPQWSVRGAEAGLHLWLEPPEPIDEPALVDAAEQLGLLVLGISTMCGAATPDGLLLCFARLNVHQADSTGAALAEAVRTSHQLRRSHLRASEPAPSSTGGSGATGVDFFPPAASRQPQWAAEDTVAHIG